MNAKTCPLCHTAIPENAPGGLCPACVLRDADEPFAEASDAPPLDEVAAAFPKLEIIRLIGHGGMGYVYQARQPELDRTVALKILSPALRSDPAFEERFAREARVLGKLQHPNIVTLFEHGESGGFFYLLMEHIDGVNLRQAMSAGRFTPEQALAIVPAICDALQSAHAEGVWHRDIKPENILLDRDGRVKIADFGIARILGDPERNFTLTRTGGQLGSVAYMAPEQHEKPHSVDHRADIYSLGVVIYEMLTGELPLGRFPAPSQRAAVNARIDEIVMRTLEKERELRQQSAGEVKTEVENVASDFSRSLYADQNGLKSGTTLQTSRFSRTAVVGACLVAVPFLQMLVVTGLAPRQGSGFGEIKSWWVLALVSQKFIAVIAPILATLLGWIAVSQIRRSAGKLHGLWLAVFDGLLFPLLMLDFFLTLFFHSLGIACGWWTQIYDDRSNAALIVWSCITWPIVDFIIIRRIWRTMNGQANTPAPQSTTQSDSEPPVSLQPTIFLHAVLFALIAVIFVMVLPRFGEILRDMGVPGNHIPRVGIFQETLGVLLFPVLFGIDVGLCYLVRKFGGLRGLRQWSVAVILVMVAAIGASSGALYLPLRSVIDTFGGQTSEQRAQRAAKPAPQNLLSRTFAVGRLAPTQAVIEIVKTFVGQQGFLSCSLAPDPRYITVTATVGQVEAVAEYLAKRNGPSVPYGRPMVVDQWTGQPETINESVSGQSGSACFTYRGEAVEYVVYSKRPTKEFLRNGSLVMMRLDSGDLFEVTLDGEDQLRVNLASYDLSAGRAFAIDETGAVRQFPLYHTGADLASLKGTLLAQPMSAQAVVAYRDFQEFLRSKQPREFADPDVMEKMGELRKRLLDSLRGTAAEPLMLKFQQTSLDQRRAFARGDTTESQRLYQEGKQLEKEVQAILEHAGAPKFPDEVVAGSTSNQNSKATLATGVIGPAMEQAIPPNAKPGFGPVVERSLYFSDNLRTYIDFQSGELSRAERALTAHPTDEAQKAWLKQSGVDAYAIEPITNKDEKTGAVVREHPRLSSWSGGCVFALAPHSQSFDDPRAEDMEARLQEAAESQALMGGTYWFKTSDGAKGILHLFGINDSPSQVQLRYRLLAADDVAKNVESWSYTLRHLDAARLDAQMKAKPQAEVAMKVEAGVVTLTGPREAVRPLATMLRVLDQPEVKDPLQLPLFNMPPDFFTRLAIPGLMTGTELKDSLFDPAFFETLKRENITAPQLARALSAHVLELEKATFVNTGTPFESIIHTPGASTYYDGTIPCADQPDKPLTLRICRTTQMMGTKPDIAGFAPWLIEEAKKQSKEPITLPTKGAARVEAENPAVTTLAQDAAMLASTKGKAWRSGVLDLRRANGHQFQSILTLEFAPFAGNRENPPDASVKVSSASPKEGPFKVSVVIGDSNFKDVRLEEKDGTRWIKITQAIETVDRPTKKTERILNDYRSMSFGYELTADTLTLYGFPTDEVTWGSIGFIAPTRDIVFKLTP